MAASASRVAMAAREDETPFARMSGNAAMTNPAARRIAAKTRSGQNAKTRSEAAKSALEMPATSMPNQACAASHRSDATVNTMASRRSSSREGLSDAQVLSANRAMQGPPTNALTMMLAGVAGMFQVGMVPTL